MKKRIMRTAATAVLFVLAWSPAFASIDLGTFAASGTSPNDSASVAASASFLELSPGKLQITLQNTYSGDTVQLGDVLYGLYFSGATLTSLVSGQSAANSKIWTYSSGSVPATFTSYSSARDLDDPWGLNGSGSVYGLTGKDKEGLVSTKFSGGDTDGLSTMTHQPFDESSAVFIVDYSGTISSISQVAFLYGTTAQASSEIQGTLVSGGGNIGSAPEPTTWAWIAAAVPVVLLGTETLRNRRRNKLTA